MKRILITLTAAALLMGAYGCQKTPEPQPSDDPVSADPSTSPVDESSDPSSNPPSDPSENPESGISHIYPVGDALAWGWDNMAAEEMTNSDGVFTWTGEIKSQGVFKFLLQQEQNVWWPGLVRDYSSDNPYAVMIGYDDSMDNKFSVSVHGIYLVTIDTTQGETIILTLDLKEEIKDEDIVITELYLLGDSTNWGWSLDDMEAFESKGDGIFVWTGELKAGGELRFPIQKQSNVWWPCLVKGSEEGTLAMGYNDAQKNNIDVPADGIYTITVNINTMTYTIEPYAAPGTYPVEVKSLWGFQATTENPHGMTKDAHRTMAVCGDYIVLSNAYDITKMPVYDRFTGEYVGDSFINTSTIQYKSETGGDDDLEDNQQFWAIASDDAGHLVALTFVDNRDGQGGNATTRGYAWKNGLSSPPTEIEWAGIHNFGAGSTWGFSNLKVSGDVTGQAIIGSSSSSGRAMFALITEGGQVSGRYNYGIYEGSAWWSSNVIPVDIIPSGTDYSFEYFSVSGNFRQYISYCGNMIYNLSDAYWYFGGGEYQKNAIGGDFVYTRSHNLLGVLNGWYAGASDSFGNLQYYYQLVVSDLADPSDPAAFTNGLVFASRSSANEEGISGMGYGPASMISPFAYEGTVLGENALAANKSQIGDVAIVNETEDKFQVYAFVMNLGMIAYEVTFN